MNAEEKQSDEVAEEFAKKADEILLKLGKLDTMTTQIESLQHSVNQINLTVVALKVEVAQIKQDLKEATDDTNDLKTTVSSLRKDVDEENWNLQALRDKNQKELHKLQLQLLDYEIYQRRENLRFYGIPEEGIEEDTAKTLSAS